MLDYEPKQKASDDDGRAEPEVIDLLARTCVVVVGAALAVFGLYIVVAGVTGPTRDRSHYGLLGTIFFIGGSALIITALLKLGRRCG